MEVLIRIWSVRHWYQLFMSCPQIAGHWPPHM
jgi:hypothetical protein